MKLISSINNISEIDTEVFHAHTLNGNLLYYKYQQKTPFLLEIRADYTHSELVLEFTSKLLLDDYPQLINATNIYRCLSYINDLGICKLRIEAILLEATVAKCDVTKDVSVGNIKEITNAIRCNLRNHNKWTAGKYPLDEGVVISNVVKTPKYKKRLVIYDKAKELGKSENQNFISMLKNQTSVLSYFKDKVRFELNINTKAQIRKLLNIPNNDLNTVLQSKANPILTVIDEAVGNSQVKQYQCTSVRDYERMLLLQECNYDLAKVEATIRQYTSKNTSITRVMQPYKDLANQSSKVRKLNIRELLL